MNSWDLWIFWINTSTKESKKSINLIRCDVSQSKFRLGRTDSFYTNNHIQRRLFILTWAKGVKLVSLFLGNLIFNFSITEIIIIIKFIATISIAIASFFLSCSEKPSDLNRYDQIAEKSREENQQNRKLHNLKGNVKSAKSTYFKQFVSNDIMFFPDMPELEIVFDKKGNEFGGRGGIDYIFDSVDNLKEVTSKFYAGTKDSVIHGGGRQVYFYSKDGFLMKRTDMEGKDTVSESIHYFQEMSSKYHKYTKKYFSKSKGMYVEKGFFEDEYDNGKLISSIWRLTLDTFLRKGIYQYDNKGNLLEFIEYSNDNMGNFTHKTNITYNTQYRKIKDVSSLSDGSKIETYFDEQGNEVKNVKYDKDNIIGRETSYTKVYKYDLNGNWIKCETFLLDGTLATVSERKIEYWK